MRVAWMLRLYPRAWRARYQAEVAAVLADHHATLRTIVDLLFSVLDAHLDPYFQMERRLPMTNRLRSAELATFCAYIGFFVAGIGYTLLAYQVPEVATTDSTMSTSDSIIAVGTRIALLAILIGGLPIGLSIFWRAVTARQFRGLALLAVPVLALLVLAGYTAALEVALLHGRTAPLDPLPDSRYDLGGNFGLYSWAAVFLLAAVASTTAVVRAIARSSVSPRLLRFALIPATVAALAMIAVLGATLVWGISLQGAAPLPLWPSGDILAIQTSSWWLGVVVLMAASTLFAAFSVARGVRVGLRTPAALD
ncbi:MAG: hypothetical protein ACRDHP_07895 [Ktedonobacterales bacterium]